MLKCFVAPDHPVRSIKGGFAASLLKSRPPLLYQEGSSKHALKKMVRPSYLDRIYMLFKAPLNLLKSLVIVRIAAV
jgi:hypothetical protein